MKTGNEIFIYGLQYTVTVVPLLLMSIQDIRKKQISLRTLLVFAICVTGMKILNFFMTGDISVKNILCGMIPGGVLLLAGKLTGDAIGSGDGYAVAVLGIQTGFFQMTECLLYSMILSGIFGAVLLVKGKCRKKDTIPFLPFLTAGYVIISIWN